MLNSILIESDIELQSIKTDSRSTPCSSDNESDDYRQVNSCSDDEEPDSCSEYEIPEEYTIEEKEEYVRQAKEDIAEMKKRFLWDLSFAMKRKLCVEYSNTEAELKIADVSLEEIVNSVINAGAPPCKWLSMITLKFMRVV